MSGELADSRIQNSESRIQNPGSRIQIPENTIPANTTSQFLDRLVIKPGTERNETKRNEMEKIAKSVDSGVVR